MPTTGLPIATPRQRPEAHWLTLILMCGIGGILRTWPAGDTPPAPLDAIPEAWLDTLDESIAHRGPDGAGRFRQRVVRPDGATVDVALVHRRLSIIDHEGGAQPMVLGQTDIHPPPTVSRASMPYASLRPRLCPECGPDLKAIVFNGCIYNHRALRRELESIGHRFTSDHSDTEVLLHAWSAWGESCTERLEGMYAFAIWDASSADLFLARDQFGEKPLYISDGDTMVFGSNAMGVARLGNTHEGRSPLDPHSLVEWIAFGYAPKTTPWRGIRQLESGATALANGAETRHPPSTLHAHSPIARSLHEFVPLDQGRTKAVEAVDQTIEEAVGARLDADVPLACFLSGGLDSSLVARAASTRTDTLTTLCVRMPDDRYDESAHARRVAEIIGSDHHEIDASPAPADDLCDLIAQAGLPFGDSSLLPTHWVSRAARQTTSVAIGGDGGDELFLGYERHSIAGDLRAIQLVAFVTLGLSPWAFSRRNPKSAFDKIARLLIAARRRSYRSLLAIHQHPDLARLLPDAAHSCRWNDRAVTVRRAQAYDLDNHLPGDLLRKVDTASMACALEVRSPLLDRNLARMTLRMGLERLRSGEGGTVVSHAQRKGLLKAVAKKHFPADLVDRPKMGFAIPIGEWFRTDYGGMRQLLYDHLDTTDPFPCLAGAGIELDRACVRRMLREHDAAGEASLNPWHGRDHTQRLYMLLVLSIWCRGVQGASPPPTP